MKLSRVQRVLHRRLAWLTEKASSSPEGAARHHLIEESEALRTILRCQGMLDEEMLDEKLHDVREVMLPLEARSYARAKRGDDVVDSVRGLVIDIHRASKVA